MLSPVAEIGLRDLPKPTGNITLLIGPEGGLSPVEAEAAQRYGYTPVRLGGTRSAYRDGGAGGFGGDADAMGGFLKP